MSFETRLLLSRVVLVGAFLALAVAALVYRRRTARLLRDFFTAATSPTNLAIFRIVIFGAIFIDLGNDLNPNIIGFYSELPRELQSPPPPGWKYVLPYVPISPDLAAWSLRLIAVFSFTAAIGLCARTSAWLVVLLGLYAMGIPQYYGKTNHVHHTLWFATILAASRCADVLSVDALLRRWRKRSAGLPVEPPAPSVAYALPLRFVWILIGMIYFFPGFWKAWHSGIDWAFSDNFANRMYEKWYQLAGTFEPMLRLDHYPWLYKPSALFAILFELSFIVLIFFPRLRWFAVLGGLGFHIGTRVLMGISFWSLVIAYASFVDWASLYRRLRGREVTEQAAGAAERETIGAEPRIAWRSYRWPVGAIAVFSVLLIGNGLCGLAEERDAWPVTCYPPFSGMAPNYVKTVDVVALDGAGNPIPWDESGLRDRFSKSRYAALMKRLREERREEHLRAFWQVLSRESEPMRRATTVRFYDVSVATAPEEKGRVLSRDLVWEVAPRGEPTTPTTLTDVGT